MHFIKYEFPNTGGDDPWLIMQQEHQILKTRREQLGLTQQQVADQSKIQLRQYQRLESGERSMISASMRIALSICLVLKLDPYIFLDGKERFCE